MRISTGCGVSMKTGSECQVWVSRMYAEVIRRKWKPIQRYSLPNTVSEMVRNVDWRRLQDIMIPFIWDNIILKLVYDVEQWASMLIEYLSDRKVEKNKKSCLQL